MLRIALLTALVAAASATYGHPCYGLDRLLAKQQIPPALALLTGRYPGISSPAAAQIVQISITHPSGQILQAIKYTTVPSLLSGQRLPYLQALFGALPAKPFYTSYVNPLTRYLAGMGIQVPGSSLVDPLALTDYYLGTNRLAPLSSSLFNKFFANDLLGLKRPHYSTYRFPKFPYFLSALSRYRFPGSRYFRVIRPSSIITRPAILRPGVLRRSPLFGSSSILRPSILYRGPGSAFLPVYPALGLQYPVNPAITLAGLQTYLLGRQVPLPGFTSYIRGLPDIAKLIRSIQPGTFRSYIQPFSYLSDPLLSRDLFPLLASRYYSYPSNVRSSIYYGSQLATFPTLLNRYIQSPFFSRLSSYPAYSPAFVSSTLTSFDDYTRYLSAPRLGSYLGPYWPSNLISGPSIPSVTYTGPGSAFLPVYPALGLPYPVNPAATLGGLNSYLISSQVVLPRFVSYIRTVRQVPSVVGSVHTQAIRASISRLPFLTAPIVHRDLFPLYASRYYAYPENVRTSVYIGSNVADFRSLVYRYFESPYFSRLSSHTVYNPGFVSATLTSFDSYVQQLAQPRLGSYRGPYWLSNLLLYSGPGSAFLPVYPSLGIPYPVKPSVTLPGLNAYLRATQIKLPSFVSYIRNAKKLAKLIRSIRAKTIKSYIRKFPYLNSPLIERDLFPLFASRYYSYPENVRTNIFAGPQQGIFPKIVTDYFQSPFFSRLSVYPSYSPDFVSSALSGFDDFTRYSTIPRLGSYLGPYWPSTLGSPISRLSYSGPGSPFLPLYPALGLPYPVNPAGTLGGLNTYLTGQHVAVPGYVSYIQAARQVSRLVGSVHPYAIRSYLGRLPFLSGSLVQRDIFPLFASRYYSYPQNVQSNIYIGQQPASFSSLVYNYFQSPSFAGLSSYSAYNPAFVSATLSSFDTYARGLALPRLGGYQGPYWPNNLVVRPRVTSSVSVAQPGRVARVTYSGPGSSFLPVYPALGLPYPVNPAVTLGGLNTFLSSRQVGLPGFTSYIRQSPGLVPLIRSINLSSYSPYFQRFGGISGDIFQRDLLPLFASRYYSFPRYIRSRLYNNSRRASFPSLLSSYFRSPLASRLSSFSRYSPDFVSSALGGFDSYCRKLSLPRLGKYTGPYWLRKLLHRRIKGLKG